MRRPPSWPTSNPSGTHTTRCWRAISSCCRHRLGCFTFRPSTTRPRTPCWQTPRPPCWRSRPTASGQRPTRAKSGGSDASEGPRPTATAAAPNSSPRPGSPRTSRPCKASSYSSPCCTVPRALLIARGQAASPRHHASHEPVSSRHPAALGGAVAAAHAARPPWTDPAAAHTAHSAGSTGGADSSAPASGSPAGTTRHRPSTVA
mmetsp:Transcript_30765/g.80513  ORF Transcript_30765/g.80513 Transcript_30765/m.80513 type:complete len:204 (+) Transcript_30765:611-1222(+)